MVEEYRFIPYRTEPLAEAESLSRGKALYEELNQRRSCRHFSSRPVPRQAIEYAIRCAGTAPSGAHRQPWTFVCVSDAETKRRIRIAAEEEERESYEGGRMPPEWLEALAPLGTDWQKPYLETVPWLVVCFEQIYGFDAHGLKLKHYYVKESVGIACGLFIAAVHRMGLATLTHTPSPMGFLSKILGRPANEKPYVLFPVGHPASDARVPDLNRHPLDRISVWDPKLEPA